MTGGPYKKRKGHRETQTQGKGHVRAEAETAGLMQPWNHWELEEAGRVLLYSGERGGGGSQALPTTLNFGLLATRTER